MSLAVAASRPVSPGPAGYDVEFTLQPESDDPSATLAADSGLSLVIKGREAGLFHKGRRLAAGKLPGGELRLTFRRRSSWATLCGPDGLVLQTEAPPVARGQCDLKADGFRVGRFRIQPAGWMLFTDEFTREKSLGGWETDGHRWKLTTVVRDAQKSASPFRLFYEPGEDRQGGVLVTGHRNWDGYLVACSLRFTSERCVGGLVFDRVSDGDFSAFRWDGRKGVELVAVAGGEEETVARKAMRFRPNQWYRLAVADHRGKASCFIDENPVLEGTHARFCGGKVGLWAEGGRTYFDDFSARSTEKACDGRPTEESLVRALRSDPALRAKVTPFFATRPTMRAWATSEGAWDERAGVRWSRSYLHGPASLRWQAGRGTDFGTVMLAYSPEPHSLEGALRAVVDVDDAFKSLVARVYSGEDLLVSKDLPFARLSSARLRLDDGKAILSVNDQEMAVEHERPLRGFMPAYACIGAPDGGALLGSPLLFDYAFNSAPCEWIEDGGTWEQHSRWTCDPRFSWFGGRNESGPARLWNKRLFSGDVSLDFYCAPMMLSKGWPQGYHFPFNIQARICADGIGPARGYTFVYGNVDVPSKIVREGKVVAETRDLVNTELYRTHPEIRAERIHRRWIHVRATKRGGRVELFVDGRSLLSFDDPEPLSGPFVCLGTSRNGVMLARVKISAEGTKGMRLWLRE